MKMTDLRAKARAIFGPAIAEPMPKQPNGAKALQQRANARPIPTYKVGGPVKKPMPSPGESVKSGNRMSKQEGDEMRFMDMMEKKKRPMPTPAESVKSGNRMAREEGAEMRKMKMAVGGRAPAPNKMSVDYGPAKRPEPPPTRERSPAPKSALQDALMKMSQPTPPSQERKPKIELSASGKARLEAQKAAKAEAQELAMKRAPERPMPAVPKVTPPDTNPKINLGSAGRVAKGSFVDPFRLTAPSGPPPAGMAPVDPSKAAMMKKGGKVQTSSDTARKLATEMGGMKKGGKPKNGLAVMIAIGSPKKPAKKMDGGPMGYMDGGEPMGYAAGGAGKMRKGQAPIKKAQGGAAKVRKGMMSPEGNIIDAMNKMRGK